MCKVLQKGNDITRPADRDGRGGKQIFENQIPADDPGDEFAERRVAVSVGRAGKRNHRGKFRVTKPGEGAGQSGEDEGINNGRSGVLRGGLAGEDKNAGADDRADAQRGEVDGAEGAFEAFVRQHLGLQVGDASAAKQVHAGEFQLVLSLLNEAPAVGSQANASALRFAARILWREVERIDALEMAPTFRHLAANSNRSKAPIPAAEMSC